MYEYCKKRYDIVRDNVVLDKRIESHTLVQMIINLDLATF